MRVLFLGSGAIAEQCLLLLLDRFRHSHSLVGLVAPAALLWYLSPMDTQAEHTAVLEIDANDRREPELLEMISTVRPDVLVSVQYPWILSGDVLRWMGGRVANLHNARLPDYRGHHAISHEILNGECRHTVTLHWMAEEVDRGLEIDTESRPIHPEDTAYSIWRRSVDACVTLFGRFLEDTRAAIPTVVGRPIPAGGRFFSRQGIQAAKRIPNGATPADIDRISRAFCFPPHEPAFIEYEGRKLYVLPFQYRYEIADPQ